MRSLTGTALWFSLNVISIRVWPQLVGLHYVPRWSWYVIFSGGKHHGWMEKIMSAKTVFVHRNGVNRAPKTIVVNPRQVRTFDSLLDKVTASLKTPGAVRTIRTPTGRHRISKLDELEDERAYVAVGTEGFKRIEWVLCLLCDDVCWPVAVLLYLPMSLPCLII